MQHGAAGRVRGAHTRRCPPGSASLGPTEESYQWCTRPKRMGAQHGSAAAAAHRSRSRAASPTCLHAGLCSGMSQSKCPIRARDWDTQAVGTSRALCAARRRWEVSTRSRRGVRTAREDIEQRERGQAWDKHHGGRAAPRGRPAARDKRHAAEQGGTTERKLVSSIAIGAGRTRQCGSMSAD